jgi:hypothetical protein
MSMSMSMAMPTTQATGGTMRSRGLVAARRSHRGAGGRWKAHSVVTTTIRLRNSHQCSWSTRRPSSHALPCVLCVREARQELQFARASHGSRLPSLLYLPHRRLPSSPSSCQLDQAVALAECDTLLTTRLDVSSWTHARTPVTVAVPLSSCIEAP